MTPEKTKHSRVQQTSPKQQNYNYEKVTLYKKEITIFLIKSRIHQTQKWPKPGPSHFPHRSLSPEYPFLLLPWGEEHRTLCFKLVPKTLPTMASSFMEIGLKYSNKCSKKEAQAKTTFLPSLLPPFISSFLPFVSTQDLYPSRAVSLLQGVMELSEEHLRVLKDGGSSTRWSGQIWMN